ncbi:uncharacterized protein [Palaemon carinicauda]|uniref:uncharacterized protein n=1 Tax=Palaemon carinicauda TaxID=392227 RepID=UPI0035B62CD6
MVYQDHLTKFCILRALTSKRVAEVAFHPLDIFHIFGGPVILQSDNRSEFTSQVITELKEVWPKLTLVHDKPCHPQSQGSVERANGDIKDMLMAWMAENDSQDWPTGIRFVQFQKNSALHSGIKCSTYSAMFGCEARVGLTTSSLAMEVIARMETEDDLLAVTPIRPDSDNDNSLAQTDGVANQIQATSDETTTHDLTEDVLLPVEHGSTTTQYTGDNVTSQPMTEEILDLSTGPSSPRATPSAYNVESPVSSGESEEPVDKATRDATVLAPKSVVQGDVNALKLGFCVTHDVIAASIVVTRYIHWPTLSALSKEVDYLGMEIGDII